VYGLKVVHCAFELHPGVPPEGQPIPWPAERMSAAHARFEPVAAAEGLVYRTRSHWYNSVPAHEAALWADEHGDGEEFRRRVYRAYFADLLNIGSIDVLAELASELGMPAHDLREALDQGRYREKVARQFQYARDAGITGVPAYIVGRYLMVGAQPLEVYRELIETVQAEQAAGPAVERSP
jgi:predicted DsbA family dithiol-disulfide isomerase